MSAIRVDRQRTLPFGIDLGADRVRVAFAVLNPDGRTELMAVASRDCGNDPTAALIGAIAEIRTSERRCVFGLGEPHALMSNVRFPKMGRAEAERAARFEAMQLVEYPINDAIVRVAPVGSEGVTLIGVVRRETIRSLVALAHAAKLRVTAVDNTGFALRRALPGADAVLDIGKHDSRLHVFAGPAPIGRRFAIGGSSFTQAVAQAYGLDMATAERRKRSYGIAGCAETIRDRLIADVANALVECRAGGLGDVRTMALVGNGSRLAELPALIERATAVRVRPATLDAAISRTLPADVLRAAAPDWSLAYGLALWSTS